MTKPADFPEETDPAKLPPAGGHWDAFMNHNWLPMLAKKYDAELCDQRMLWKAYLREHNLEPKALLQDAVHLNAYGEWLMAECAKAYLRRWSVLRYRQRLFASVGQFTASFRHHCVPGASRSLSN